MVFKSNVERLIAFSTSAVAVRCSSASFSSRVSRATFVSEPAADELRRRAVFGPLRRSVAAFRRRVLAGSPPALERRLIGSP